MLLLKSCFLKYISLFSTHAHDQLFGEDLGLCSCSFNFPLAAVIHLAGGDSPCLLGCVY